MDATRGFRDGFTHHEQGTGRAYVLGALLGNTLGRLVDRALRWA